MFSSVLVANRGEIAVRIFKTCRRLGIRTIAVYSDADARALHVREADEAYRLGPPPAAESYLDQAAILGAARASGAEALHPGYGFLAENADFAQACLDAGLAWIGPPPEAMRALGDKARAKALAERVGVPVLPGYHGEEQDPAFLAQQAARIGFPVLVKARAGGGGRGLRVVESPDTFAEALEAAQREAQASFGDPRVLLERYLSRPRHVEVQILADQHGQYVHLGERECSIQRRHQKLIEESPSPAVDEPLRARMGEAALTLARAAGYTNAGTVEFLLAPDGAFSFLEVNARLQVEHPVTELVTGLDLVELQLRVAAGGSLGPRQDEIELDGHAIEVRLIAEDPAAGFLPSTGRIERFDLPEAAPGVRVDTGFTAGAEVSPYYDSLLAKLVVAAEDRRAALETLREALAATVVQGVASNVDLLLAVVSEPAFSAGALHTGFLAEHRVVERLAELPPEVLATAAVLAAHASPGDRADADPWRAASGWRVGGLLGPSEWLVAGRVHRVALSRDPATGHLAADVNGQAVVGERLPGGSLRFGSQTATGVLLGQQVAVTWAGRTYRLARPPSLEAVAAEHAAGDTASGALTAPMPGRVVKLAVQEGEQVMENQPLLVLEAMKMEHVIQAPRAGLVRALYVTQGEQVARGAPLVEVSRPTNPANPASPATPVARGTEGVSA